MNGPTGSDLFDTDISTPMATFNEIWFSAVSEPYGWMSNMSPHPVEHGGFTWPTTEALFQALRFDDAQIREDIRTQTSPRGAKMKAKRNDYRSRRVVEPMSPTDLQNMRLCLRLKVGAYPGLQQRLLATGTAVIHEDVSARKGGSTLYWGARRTPQGVEGTNTLGSLWMELREELRRGAGAVAPRPH
jgi:predicted NAD-dependent protein-ADP-ribosyltransferase YbiA (DUF1768 family)